MKNRPDSQYIPSEYTLGNAISDTIPFLFYTITLVVLCFYFRHITTYLGASLTIIAAFLNLLHEYILISGKNIRMLSLQKKLLTPLGLILIATGLIKERYSFSWSYFFEWLFQPPFFYLCIISIIGIFFMLIASLLKSQSSRKHHLLQIVNIITAFLAFLTIVSLTYLCDFYHSVHTQAEYSRLYPEITITDKDNYISLSCSASDTCIIFYPGAKVEPESYIPLFAEIAKKGYECYIAKMPYNFAIFDINIADSIIASHTEKTSFYIAGHSLGGAMAANYAANNSEKLDGLILLAGYSTSDISDKGLKALSIRGENDQVLNSVNYKKYMTNLPDDTVEYIITGGNHAQFGDYGKQKDDGNALIDASMQRSLTAEQIISLINGVKN